MAAMQKLNNREKLVVARYFGLSGRAAMSFNKIGREIGLSREVTRKIKLRAIEKMKKILNQSILMPTVWGEICA